MAKLIITADIHGRYTSWLTMKALLSPGDSLVVAGDLFDTKYGKDTNSDFQPDSIKKEIAILNHPFYYVYGNCDTPSFSPGFDATVEFNAFKKRIFLHHGHRSYKYAQHIDIVIQGHTHLCSLKKKAGQIFMNPGSIIYPRNGVYTYGVIDTASASLIELKTGKKLCEIDF